MVTDDEQVFRDKGFEYTNQPTTHRYTHAIDSGLRILKPYPNPDDVCGVVIKRRCLLSLLKNMGN